jgi:hypothetical protein
LYYFTQLHLKLEDLANGEVALTNCPTGVALVGSHLEGTVKIRKIHASVKKILVTVTETTHVVVEGNFSEAASEYQMVPATVSSSQRQKGIEQGTPFCPKISSRVADGGAILQCLRVVSRSLSMRIVVRRSVRRRKSGCSSMS